VNFLLDTNGVSEWVKPVPDPGLVTWLAAVDEDRVFLSVVTLAELRHGVERLVDGRRRARLEVWLNQELTERFAGRVLAVDGAIAHAWGRLVARAEAAGQRLSVMDGFIAATAQIHELTLVTRNVKDFVSSGITVHNPWTG
jgi:predicted nucleic acid-binding protein